MSVTEIQLWGLSRTADVILCLLLSSNIQRRHNPQRFGLGFCLEMANMDGNLEGFPRTRPCSLTPSTAYSKTMIFPKI